MTGRLEAQIKDLSERLIIASAALGALDAKITAADKAKAASKTSAKIGAFLGGKGKPGSSA